MNNTLCSAFWNHTNLRGGDRIFPCCRFKKPVDTFDGDLSATLHSPNYIKLRELSSEGKEIDGCQKCYMEEALGKKSLRQEFNETYTTDTVELKFFEVGFDNICNLTCDGCWGEFSSAWANKENPHVPKKENVLDTTEITALPQTIEKIIFLGGEPLMTNRHMKLLSKIEDLSKVEVTYYTNGTFLLTDAEIDLLKQTDKTTFIVSIDGVGAVNDKVRSGSLWADILKFFDQLEQHSFDISVHSVVHMNNWHGLVDLCNFIHSRQFNWTTGLLTFPAKLSILNISSSDQEALVDILKSHNIPNGQFMIEYINENRTNKPIFKLAEL